MKREDQLYNAAVIIADLIGERVSAHLSKQLPIMPPEKSALSIDEAVELFGEWEKEKGKLTNCEESDQPLRLIPVTEWNKYYSYPKVSTLRHLIFHSEKNGFDKVVRRIGRRVLINEQAFFQWVEEENKVGVNMKKY